MPHGYKREYNDVLYFKKDHFCPDCKTKLEKVPVSKVVNSRSPEAKDFDFSIGGDTYAVAMMFYKMKYAEGFNRIMITNGE